MSNLFPTPSPMPRIASAFLASLAALVMVASIDRLAQHYDAQAVAAAQPPIVASR